MAALDVACGAFSEHQDRRTADRAADRAHALTHQKTHKLLEEI